jgi:PAS domain S-box-containing protein
LPGSLTDLAGLSVSAEDFLAAVLDASAQPIWVVDHAGVIRFANGAAIAALGYDSADELSGRPSHETIHHRHPDGSPYPAAECPMLRPRTTGETVASDLDWFFRRDGSMFPVSYVSAPLAMPEGRGAVVAFTDIEDRVRAERVLREHDAVLRAREASLRRIATLVAGGAASAEVFAAIAREVADVVGLPLVVVWRYERDGTATVMGAWGERPHRFLAGTRWPLAGPTIAALVLETGRPARIDAVAGAPIVIDGDVWGLMSTAAPEPLPDRIEHRLTEFTELVATAISTAAGREEVARLADEQAALRRVATLVAGNAPSGEVLAAVAEEVGRLLRVDTTATCRYEADRTATVVAVWGDSALPLGTRTTLDDEDVGGLVLRTGRPARIDDHTHAAGYVGSRVRAVGIRCAVGCPIVVDGQLWGVMIAASRKPGPLPASTESRIGEFTELVAMAISNVQARSDLAASRARIAAAGDEERRRVVRDLHDGAQQRLVHTIITLKQAHETLEPNGEPASGLVSEALDQAERATDELRELSQGLLPGVLRHGGLGAGVDALVARAPVPVEVDVSVDRLPRAVEATAYFVVAEALTNIAKHARATSAAVLARVEDGTLRIRVRDDGIGGARADGGGLVGLADRLAVLDGQLRVDSRADGGTLLAADIPVTP